MIDSGTTSPMTALSIRLRNREKCDISIRLADNSAIKTQSMGIWTVKWMKKGGKQNVHLSNTLIVPQISSGLLSVPSLAKKDVGVIFLPFFVFLSFIETIVANYL